VYIVFVTQTAQTIKDIKAIITKKSSITDTIDQINLLAFCGVIIAKSRTSSCLFNSNLICLEIRSISLELSIFTKADHALPYTQLSILKFSIETYITLSSI